MRLFIYAADFSPCWALEKQTAKEFGFAMHSGATPQGVN